VTQKLSGTVRKDVFSRTLFLRTAIFYSLVTNLWPVTVVQSQFSLYQRGSVRFDRLWCNRAGLKHLLFNSYQALLAKSCCSRSTSSRWSLAWRVIWCVLPRVLSYAVINTPSNRRTATNVYNMKLQEVEISGESLCRLSRDLLCGCGLHTCLAQTRRVYMLTNSIHNRKLYVQFTLGQKYFLWDA